MTRKWTRLIAWVALGVFLIADGRAIAHPCLPSSLHHNHEASCTQADCDSCHETALHEDSPTCPCHDSDAPNSSCPNPGGCAYCNIAKVPLTVPSLPAPPPSDSLEQCFGEAPLVYLSPFCGRLIRPPRF
ncbi:MAG TPA: hypothetical protein VMG10_22995 [Gemmataceae bacterium]|nr:hypothetical protein [Gemmataceae bacterium]